MTSSLVLLNIAPLSWRDRVAPSVLATRPWPGLAWAGYMGPYGPDGDLTAERIVTVSQSSLALQSRFNMIGKIRQFP